MAIIFIQSTYFTCEISPLFMRMIVYLRVQFQLGHIAHYFKKMRKIFNKLQQDIAVLLIVKAAEINFFIGENDRQGAKLNRTTRWSKKY